MPINQLSTAMLCRFILVLALLFTARPLMAMQANGCDDFVDPVISVKQLVITPRYNDTFNLATIRKLAIEGGQNIVGGSHETPVGLTAASLKLDSRFQINVKKRGDDYMVCAQISAFDLNFGFDDTTVYIANELPHGSCSYRTVLEHELRHVQTDQYLVQAYVPILPDLLRNALRHIGTIRASSSEAAEEEIRASISKYMADLGKNLSQVRQKHQAEIDTKQEYERLSRSCDNALASLVKDVKGSSAY